MTSDGNCQLSWAGWSDLPSLSALLRDSFSPGSRLSRVRYAVKLLTTPHLTATGADVVIGVVTNTRRVRMAWSWSFDQRGRPFDRSNIPKTLLNSQHTWRIVNLAGSQSTNPVTTVRLARAFISLADTCGAVMSFASSPDTRYIQTYERLGFIRTTDDLCPEFVRQPRH